MFSGILSDEGQIEIMAENVTALLAGGSSSEIWNKIPTFNAFDGLEKHWDQPNWCKRFRNPTKTAFMTAQIVYRLEGISKHKIVNKNQHVIFGTFVQNLLKTKTKIKKQKLWNILLPNIHARF